MQKNLNNLQSSELIFLRMLANYIYDSDKQATLFAETFHGTSMNCINF